MSQRIIQINSLIREHLGNIILREVTFKTGTLVTITKVDTSADLRHTKVHFSAYPEGDSEYALQTLLHEKRVIQRALHEKLHMKPLPKLSFLSDPTEKNADVVERLLRDIKGD